MRPVVRLRLDAVTDASQTWTSQLLAFVDDEIDEALVAEIRTAIADAANDRPWSVRPPEFVDDNDDARTVGCVLYLPASRDERGHPVAVELDAASLDDTKALVALLAPISRRRNIDIGFELDGDSAGWLLNGEPDAGLATGLIAAWEAHIEAARSAE